MRPINIRNINISFDKIPRSLVMPIVTPTVFSAERISKIICDKEKLSIDEITKTATNAIKIYNVPTAVAVRISFLSIFLLKTKISFFLSL